MAEALPFPELSAKACANCGFLAARSFSHGEFPAQRAQREFGDFGSDPYVRDTDPSHYYPPRCWLGAAELSDEVGALVADGLPVLDAHKSVITDTTRDCGASLVWRPWLTFAQHWDLYTVLELEEQRRKWQGDLEEDRKLWAQKLEGDRKSFELQLNEQAEKWERSVRKETRWWQVLILAVTIVGIVVAVECNGGSTPNQPSVSGTTSPPSATP